MDTDPASAVVFEGPRALCREYSLVLEAKAIQHEALDMGGVWLLTVASSLRAAALDELVRYAAEKTPARPQSRFVERYAGAGIGAALYASILVGVAYCAGLGLFDADWYAAGVADAGALHAEWWRAFTALTLHADPMHLLGNLFFGVLVSIGASRLLGPGIVWFTALASAACANTVAMWTAPSSHSSLGASTAVFAILGLLTGLAWTERMSFKEQRWYRFAPIFGGVGLLSLFGAGDAHVDVYGHLLGFAFGTLAGWLCAVTGMPRSSRPSVQLIFGSGAILTVGVAWILALSHLNAI
jgi:rhomboid protease GluP